MNRRRLRKLLLWGGLGLVTLVLLLGLAVWFLAGTQGGTKFLFTRLGAMLPGSLTVAELKGPLRGPLDIRGLRYEREGFEMSVERVQLEWRLRQLLDRQLDIQRLHADGVRIVTTPSEEEKERKPLPDVNLRFNVIVRDARVRDMTFSSASAAPGEKPFVIDRVDLETTALGSDVRIDRLTVRSPTFDADVAGSVRPQGDYPVDLDVRWALRLPDLAPLSGQGTLGGTLEELKVAQRLREPFGVEADLRLLQPLYDLRFAGTVRAPRANPRLLKADLPDIPAGGTITAEGTLAEFTGQGDVRATLPQTGPVAVDFQIVRDNEEWLVRRADVALTGTPTRLSARGRISTEGDELGFEAEASWQNFSWPLRGAEPLVVSRRGTASVEGAVTGYEARVQAHLAAPAAGKVPAGNWTVAGRGDQDSFRFSTLQGDILGGRITGQGQVAWKPEVRWTAALRGTGINPQALVASMPGSLSFAAASQGRLADEGPVGTVQVSSLEGTLRGEPVRAVAGLELAGPRYRISRLDAAWSTARLSASGWLGDTWDLTWNATVPNLAPMVPQGGGSVTAQGRISGPGETPRIEATAQGEDLRFGTQTVSSVQAVADMRLAPAGPFSLDATVRGLQSGERRVEELVLRGRGTRGDHTLTAALRNIDGSLDLALAGALQGTTAWQGAIRRLDLRSRPTGDWTLGGPAPLFASAEAVRVEDFCWRSRGGSICAQGGWSQAGPWNVSSTLADLPLSLLAPWLPPDLEITGGLDGTIEARGSGAALAGAVVDLRPGPGEIRFPGDEGRTVAFRYEQGSLQARAGAGGEGTASARLVLVDAGTLSAEARLPRFVQGAALQAQALAGRVDVRLTNLGFLRGFVPDVKDPAGTLTAGYTLSGTVGRPRLLGEARLANGRADLPRLGLELRDLRLAAVGDGSGSLTLDGSVRSGEGTVAITGSTRLVPSAETPVLLAVEGRRFQAMDTEEIDLLVSPDLDVVYAGDLVRVTGEVVVPEADIAIEDRREKGPVQASEDVVFVNATAEPDARRDLAVAAEVRVVLGRDVQVNLFGLKGKPTGSLLVRDEPGRVTHGTGELEINEGTFKAYGQDLTIERGRIVFAGPIDNPAIDVRAFRRADDGTVAGINAKGTVQKPEVTLWSEPTLPESEALAYLLLGRPLRQVQPEEGDRLANAATSLGLKGGNLLAKRLAARWGLEEARIEAEGSDLDQASLVVGKYLSPRLYVAYGIGLFEAVNTFRIRYLINDKWSLQAESGEGTSADALYTIER